MTAASEHRAERSGQIRAGADGIRLFEDPYPWSVTLPWSATAPPRPSQPSRHAGPPGSSRPHSRLTSAPPVHRNTLFASHKLPLRTYLGAIAIFCNEVKGEAALALSRDLGVSYKSAFVLAHKLLEAMAEELRGRVIGGDGKTAEVDAAYFGVYQKPASHKHNRCDRRLARNQNGKRKSVIIVRERNRHSVPAVFAFESAALA